MVRLECYIRKYKENKETRLIDKHTGKVVYILHNNDSDKTQFEDFLKLINKYKRFVKSIFTPNGYDVVALYGDKEKETDTEIYINTNITDGHYIVEYTKPLDKPIGQLT